jgi:hypothetical protein
MHPMFVELFLETCADDALAEEEDKRRTVNRARRNRSRRAAKLTVAARDRDHRPAR